MYITTTFFLFKGMKTIKGKGALVDKFNLKKKVQIRQSKLELLCDKGIWDRF
jgi:hypothetical protein